MLGGLSTRSVSGRLRRRLRAVSVQFAILVLTLVVIEFFLRGIDLRYLRLAPRGQSLLYAYDQELGWSPVPNSDSKFTTATRTISVHNNSLGLRDIEPDSAPKPTIMFLGDSFVWGYDVEADERLTEFIRGELPDYRIVNAGVSGYGTDQEYLLLQRLWDQIKPDVVVLIYFYNDHDDNRTNARYGLFKPYFQLSPQAGEFRGQPAPKSRHYYFRNNWFARKSLLARVAISAYVAIRHPVVSVPDPTEHLVGMMRDFVETHGAKFLVGELDGRGMVGFLQAEKIPYVSLDEPPGRDGLRYRMGRGLGHWTPVGHAVVGAALMKLFEETGIAVPASALSASRRIKRP
jgi:hypothetical protein